MFKKIILPTIFSLLIITFLIFIIISRNNEYEYYVDIVEFENSNKNQISLQIDESTDNRNIYFYSNSDKITVIINGSKEVFENDYQTKKLYSVSLPQEAVEIIIYFDDVTGVLIPVDRVFIGDGLSFTHYLLSRDLVLILVTIFMLFISVLIVFLSIYYFFLNSKSSIIVGYPIFFLASSIWCLTQVDFMIYLLQGNKAFYYLQQYIIFLIPMSIAIVSVSFNKSAANKILSSVLILSYAMLSLVSFILDLGEIRVITIINYVTIISTIVYLIILAAMLKNTDKDNRSKSYPMFISSIIIIAFGLLVDILKLVSPYSSNLYGMYFTICLLFVYIFSISTIAREYIIRENNRVYLSEENARLSSSILLSQIKPHFLYNALNSISLLCKKDPKQADMAVIRFSRYLRQNMKCIESSELVDFDAEMEHIRNYIYLENIRFPKMEIIYELKFLDFKVPPLCIQPIVENAVKHGVSKNTNGGYIIIKSFATANYINIEISDNGPGFDGKIDAHGTGLSNISRRLKMLINAEIEFGSVVGKGTIVMVRIPRKEVN